MNFGCGFVQVASGAIGAEEIDEAAFSGALWTAELPDPDLIVRTSGELRLSNFLLWQAAYAELYVTDVPWPAFRRPELEEALAAYRSRQRRYGRTGEQILSGSDT